MEKIYHTQGDTLLMALNVTDSAGVPVDLTGGGITFTISAGPTAAPVLQKACTILDAVNGSAQVSATAVEMNFDIGIYKWELQFTGPTGDISTTPMQAFEILPQLTQ